MKKNRFYRLLKVEEGFSSFFFYLIIFFVFLSVFFIVIVNFWEFFAQIVGIDKIGFNDESTPISEPGKFLDSISNSLGLVIGAPVALAGSFVAIVLAQRALSISERQEFNDNVNMIDEKVNELTRTLWDLSKEYRRFSNSVQKLHRCYVDKVLPDNDYDHVTLIRLSKQTEEFQENFVNAFLEVMKNPTIKEYIKEKNSSLAVNRFVEQIYKNNGCEFDEAGEQELFRLSDLSELAFKLEFSFSAEEYEQQLEGFFSDVSFTLEFGSQFMNNENIDEIGESNFSYLEYGFHCSPGFWYSSEQFIEQAIKKPSPESIFIQGALFGKNEYFLSKFRKEPLLSVDGDKYYPYSEFKKFDFYDSDESYIWDETELIVSNLNLGAGFILEFIKMYNMGTDKLKELFIKSNHLYFVEENSKLEQLINQQFSTIDISTFLPQIVFEYIDFIEHYELFAFADSKFIGMSEKFDSAKKDKDRNGVWPVNREDLFTSEELRIRNLISGAHKKDNNKNIHTDTDTEDLPF